MKFLSLILILSSTFSYADDAQIDPVTDTQLVLVGRGFRNKATNENIALACLDPSCAVLRFVYFDDSNQAYYIGERLVAPKASDEKTQEEATALLVREFFYLHQTRSSAEKIDRSIIRKGVVILGGAVALALAVPTGGSALLPIAASSVWSAGAMYVFSSSNAMDAVVSGSSRATLTDRDGWSWSSKPKKVNRDMFRSLLARIQHGKPLIHFANEVRGSWERGDKMQAQVDRKRARLEGVQWFDQTWTR